MNKGVGALVIVASLVASASAERGVRRFVEVVISPDGVNVASIEGEAPISGFEPRRRELVIRRLKDGDSTTVSLPCGRSPQCRPDSATWSPDGLSLAFTLRLPGKPGRSIYCVDARGKHLRKLLEFDGRLLSIRYGPEGKLAALATDSSGQRIALIESARLTWASAPGLYVHDFDWRPDGGFVAVASGGGENDWWTSKLYSFELSGSTKVLYSPADARQQLARPRVSPDGKNVALIVGLMSEKSSPGGDLYLIPFTGGGAVNVTPGTATTVRDAVWDCQGQPLATTLEGENQNFVTITSSGARTLWSGPESLADNRGGPSLACPSGIFAVAHESFSLPPEIKVGKNGEWRDLTRENRGMSMPLTAQSLNWKVDGFAVQGWLLLPERRSASMPLVTALHGGPASAWTPMFFGPGLNKALLDKGFAIFRPNPRGSFGNGEVFTQAAVRDFGGGDYRDILAGIDAVKAAASIDESRLALIGGSYGGFLTMWAVTQSRRFKAAVALAGISDWSAFDHSTDMDGWLPAYFGASLMDDATSYARSSPLNFVKNVSTPLLAYGGEDDNTCPPSQTQRFVDALVAQNVAATAVIYPGEGHGILHPEHTADVERRILDWLDRYVR